MAIPSIFRRIWLSNLNVISVINNETGSEKINSSKIAGYVSGQSIVAPSLGFTADSVNSAIGHQFTFSAPYGTTILADGDYMVLAEAYIGTLKVGCSVTKSASSVLVKPDVDLASVRVAIIPLLAG